MFDLFLRNGRIMDGTGQTWYRGGVGISGDSLAIVRSGEGDVEAGRVIDVNGSVICPGFIDMHSHSDLVLLSNPRHEVKLRQGVTTELMGMDGLSYAPSSPEKLEQLLYYLAAVNGSPPEGVRWGSVREYLDCSTAGWPATWPSWRPMPPSAWRRWAGTIACPPSRNWPACASWPGKPCRTALSDSATGLTYPPGAYSDTNELVAVSEAIADLGGIYMTHARYSLGDRLLDPFREAIEVGRRAGVPVHISHYHNPVDGMGEQMVGLVDEGRNAGIDVTFDQYPYAAASTVLHSLLPYWVHAGGPGALLNRIRQPAIRDEIGDAVEPMWGLTLDHYIFSNVPKNKEWEGRSLGDLARHQGKRMVDAICDLLIEENLEVAFVARTGNPDNIRTIVRHPAQMVGSDGIMTGDMPNPRTYGTFPYVLGQFCREEGLFRLEDAVRRMTSAPAQRLGLQDRGILRDGMKADVVVFDPETPSGPTRPSMSRSSTPTESRMCWSTARWSWKAAFTREPFPVGPCAPSSAVRQGGDTSTDG